MAAPHTSPITNAEWAASAGRGAADLVNRWAAHARLDRVRWTIKGEPEEGTVADFATFAASLVEGAMLASGQHSMVAAAVALETLLNQPSIEWHRGGLLGGRWRTLDRLGTGERQRLGLYLGTWRALD